MNRREFLQVGVGSALAAPIVAGPAGALDSEDLRRQFPRASQDVYLNAAGASPLGSFAEAALNRYLDLWRLGPGDGRDTYLRTAMSGARRLFAELIHAEESEIALVHCTKAGEQIVLDGLAALRKGGNVVTNDLHFSGSLHNLVGLRAAGLDVRIVKSDLRDVPLAAMKDAIDDRTALVAVTLVSNVNGRIEALPELAKLAHARGAYVYADIIQAAGIYPIDVGALGIDFAACSGYKWLYGPFGTGFFYARKELQGTALVDHLFPGRARPNYAPWTRDPVADAGPYVCAPQTDASRYQPGHISYLGYCALYEGLRFIRRLGVEKIRSHCVQLGLRVKEGLDPKKYRCLSIHADRTPLVTFACASSDALVGPLREARCFVSLGGNRIRISPGIYNNDEDVDKLVAVLNRV